MKYIEHKGRAIWEFYVKTFEELRDLLENEIPQIESYVFRGHADASWRLTSSLHRLIIHARNTGAKRGSVDKFTQEHLDTFRLEIRGCRGDNPPKLDEDELWALGQHHGLATPLLALIDAGIWVTQYPVAVEGNGSLLGLVTKLVHAESGEWQESLIVMPLAKADPQAYGSALTYARRYGLSSMIGLVTEDDDANMACKGVPHDSLNYGFSDLERTGISAIKPRQNAVMENLPHIDGIIYQQQKAQDGALYITATGNTRNKNGILKEAGFKWNSSRKLWWKAA